VGVATDHGGFALKEDLVARLLAARHEVVDFGALRITPDDDYPDFVVPLAESVAAGTIERGVAICGSGVGASVCANKIPGVRAGLVHDHFTARQGVEDDQHEHPLHGRPNRGSVCCVGPGRNIPGCPVQSGRAAPATSCQSGFPGTSARRRIRRDL